MRTEAEIKKALAVCEAAAKAGFGERSQCPFLSCNEFSDGECSPFECYANIALRWALELPMPDDLEDEDDENRG
jgi:hypothetical protein